MNDPIDTLRDGFMDDPLFTYAFPDPQRRGRLLPGLFRGSLWHANRTGGVATARDGGGVAAWVPSHRMKVTLLDALRGRMLRLPLQAGLSSWRRFERYEDEADAATAREDNAPFGYLWMLATHSSRRGEGLGRAALEGALEQMARAGLTECRLRTQQPRNLALYRHLGFSEVRRLTPAGSGLPTVIFSRPIGPATARAGRPSNA